MKFHFIVLLLLASSLFGHSLPVWCAQAVFSEDGKRVYVLGDEFSVLDLDHPDHFDTVTTTPLLGKDGVEAVTRGDKGSILCLNSKHIVAFHPQSQTYTKVYDAPASDTLEDLAYDTQNAILLVTMESESQEDYGDEPLKAICFKADYPLPIKVTGRMVGNIEGPIFDSKGNLFYSWHGDLWQGSVHIDEAGGGDDVTTQTLIARQPEGYRGWLFGDRIAPVARLRTASWASWNMGVTQIAIGESRLYLGMHAMGHVYGYLLSMAEPDREKKHPDYDLRQDNFTDFIQFLSSIKKVSKSLPTCLCASPDGKRIFFEAFIETSKRDVYLIEMDGNPRKLFSVGNQP